MQVLSETKGFPISEFWENGIAVVEDFFSDEDLRLINQIGSESTRETQNPEENYLSVTMSLLKSYRFQRVLFSDKILSVARTILQETPTFFGSVLAWYKKPIMNLASVGVNDLLRLKNIIPPYDSKAHIDAKGKYENLLGVRHGIEERYPVIRFGWFPQDFREHSFSMKAFAKSHKNGYINEDSRAIYLNSGPRDLLIFNLKTVHSAMSLYPRMGKKEAPELWNLTPEEEINLRQRRPDDFRDSPNSRNAVFFDFCDNSRLSELFIRNRSLSNLNNVYGQIALYDLRTSPIIRTTVDAGKMNYREDLRLAALMKWGTDRSTLMEVRSILHRLNRISMNRFGEDFCKPRMLELSGSKVLKI
jgi:hypothetical protein